MKTYHVQIEHGDDGWLVAQAVEEPAAITQGRDLDEVALMIRDAIESVTQESDFQVDLMLPATLKLARSA